MGQAETMPSNIYIPSRDNLLGHETQLHGSCSCLALQSSQVGFPKIPLGLKIEFIKSDKVFQPDTVRQFRGDPAASGKGVKNGTFAERLWELFHSGGGRIKAHKQKGMF